MIIWEAPLDETLLQTQVGEDRDHIRPSPSDAEGFESGQERAWKRQQLPSHQCLALLAP